MASTTDYAENKLIDLLLRGQGLTFGDKTLTWSAAPSLYFALFTSAPSDAGGGTEVSGNNYARVAITAALVNFSGTQAAGSETASSGTSGKSYNNVAIAFPAPSAAWGTITHLGIFDAATSGNLWWYEALDVAKEVDGTSGGPILLADQFSFTLD